MVKVYCQVCGIEFEAQKSTKKYCSKECEKANRRIKYAEAKSAGKNPNKMGIPEKECLICKRKFRPKTNAANQRSCCYECMPDGTQLGRSGFIDLIRKQRGGKCQRCGYDTYQGALEFHHIDPTKKDFTVGDRDFKLKDCVEESKKCVLICSNCHKEIHAGLWSIEEILKEKEEVEPNDTN